MNVLPFPEADVPPDLRVQQVMFQDQAWPSEQPSGPDPWHDPTLRPLSMLLVDDGRVLAALDILSKDIIHEGEPAPIWASSPSTGTCRGSTRAGWRHLPGTVVIGGTSGAPFPSDRLEKVTMSALHPRMPHRVRSLTDEGRRTAEHRDRGSAAL